jgi:DNA-directed RNA polymerase subunit RPC12/RpoP
MADIGWARSRGARAEGQGLRRGAWYRVVENPPKDYVVLDVHHVEIRIPKGDLEIRTARPEAWSVVREPHLVCPGCHARAVVPEGQKNAKCSECGRTFSIDWKDAG